MHELETIARAVRRAMEGGGGLLATVAGTRGSTYRRAGARCVIAFDGAITGSISGGCVERDLALRAREWSDFDTHLITYDSSSADDVVFGLGLGCRGTMEILVQRFDAAHPPQMPPLPQRQPFSWPLLHEGRVLHQEQIAPSPTVLIFGSGPDTEPLLAMTRLLGWNSEVVVSREIPDLRDVDAAVVMTHSFLRDLEILEALVHSNARYVGLLGPRSRGEELLTQLGEGALPLRHRLHSPAGLDLGGERPEEIALSIVAEMQAALHETRALPLRERPGPIHKSPAARTVAVVLAAGSSSRMGRAKQMLRYEEETLLHRAARVAVEAGCDETLVVLSDPALGVELGDLPVTIVENHSASEGVSSSIRRAVECASRARILFTLCDQPLITSEHLRNLLARGEAIVATRYGGALGAPAVFDPRFRAELLALRGDRGARAVIEAHRSETIALDFEPAALDVDTEADYRKL